MSFHYEAHNHHYTSSDNLDVKTVPVPTGRTMLWSGFCQGDLDFIAPCPVAQHAIKMLTVMRPGLVISGHTAHEVIVMWQTSDKLADQAAVNYSEDGYGEYSWLVESYHRRLGIFRSALKQLMELPPGNLKQDVQQAVAL